MNIERKANFAKGFEVEIGDNSGLGVNCIVPEDIKIGKDVLMGPNVYIFRGTSHLFVDKEIPIRLQGRTKKIDPVIIEDNVWIGRQVIINKGRIIKKGSIVAAGSVVTKDFPAYSIIGGNPAKLIRYR